MKSDHHQAEAEGPNPIVRDHHPVNRLTPLVFVIAFGVVSMFADFVYEGARSVAGPYLATLGAGAALVGLITGAGEAVALVFRLLTGVVADRTKRYWPISILGYAITVVSVPLLATAGQLWLASSLIVAERFGKAVRTPARDTMLAQASTDMGRGWGFAIHEALDQSGALVGPLVVALALAITGSYRLGFAVLAIPGVLVLMLLFWLRSAVPDPSRYERAADGRRGNAAVISSPPSSRFWIYTGFTSLTMFGFATFGILGYHLQARHVLVSWQIPIVYALAMGVAALASLASGRAYDKIRLRVLVVVPLLGAVVPFLSFSLDPILVWIGGAVWGAAMGVHESTMRAGVADLVPSESRATAYGIFTGVYGIAWLIGSVAIGLLYSVGLSQVVAFTVVVQALALLTFLLFLGRHGDVGAKSPS